MKSHAPSAAEPGRPDSARSGAPALVERIGAAVKVKGSLAFEQFMEMALYEPELGYYVRPEMALGAAGDFVTAPEMTPLFGAALARQATRATRMRR